MSLRKIYIAIIAIIIVSIFYIFPINKKEEKINNITYIENKNLESVYLIDKYNFISKVNVNIEEENINQRIEYLIKGSDISKNIPEGFNSLIPKNTKILDIKKNDNLLIINFSKEILKVEEENLEKMIESITYTLTEIEDVKRIKILVNNKNINEIYKTIPEVIDRGYGINKIYDIESINNLSKTVIYYINKIDDEVYYTPVTKISNNQDEKVTIIIDELKSSIIYQSNLSSYLNEAASLYNYELEDNIMTLFFNSKIFSINDKILEEVKYTIGMSIFENYDVKEVVFVVDDQKIDSFIK